MTNGLKICLLLGEEVKHARKKKLKNIAVAVYYQFALSLSDIRTLLFLCEWSLIILTPLSSRKYYICNICEHEYSINRIFLHCF